MNYAMPHKWAEGNLTAPGAHSTNGTFPITPYPEHPTWATPFTHNIFSVGSTWTTIFVCGLAASGIIYLFMLMCTDIFRQRKRKVLHLQLQDTCDFVTQVFRAIFRGIGRWIVSLGRKATWQWYWADVKGGVKAVGGFFFGIIAGLWHTFVAALWMCGLCGCCGLVPMPWRLSDEETREVMHRERFQFNGMEEPIKVKRVKREAKQQRNLVIKGYESNGGGLPFGMDLEKGSVDAEKGRNGPKNTQGCGKCKACGSSSTDASSSAESDCNGKGKDKMSVSEQGESSSSSTVVPEASKTPYTRYRSMLDV